MIVTIADILVIMIVTRSDILVIINVAITDILVIMIVTLIIAIKGDDCTPGQGIRDMMPPEAQARGCRLCSSRGQGLGPKAAS